MAEFDLAMIGAGSAGLSVAYATTHYYPTRSEVLERAAGQFYAPRLFSATVARAARVLV
jgi:cation diffusion facilitator CzcD-associated flavoprotein CzcO